MDSTDKCLKTIKNGLKVLLGNGKASGELVEDVEYLFQRDFPQISTLSANESSENVTVMVPNYFLTKSFNNLQPGEEDTRLLEIDNYIAKNPDLEDTFTKIRNTIISAKRKWSGDRPEMELYKDLEHFFRNRKETCIVFHGHQLYNIDITAPGDESSNPKLEEKDFIIINLTYRYIMVIEVKNTYGAGKSAEKADKQLMGAKESFQAYFGADLDPSWSFLPLIYCNQVKENKAPSNAYLISGTFKNAQWSCY